MSLWKPYPVQDGTKQSRNAMIDPQNLQQTTVSIKLALVLLVKVDLKTVLTFHNDFEQDSQLCLQTVGYFNSWILSKLILKVDRSCIIINIQRLA